MRIRVPYLLTNRHGTYYFRIHNQTIDIRISLRTKNTYCAVRLALHLREVIMGDGSFSDDRRMQLLLSIGLTPEKLADMREKALTDHEYAQAMNQAYLQFNSMGFGELIPKFQTSSEVLATVKHPVKQPSQPLQVTQAVESSYRLADVLELHLKSPSTQSLAPKTLADRLKHFNAFITHMGNCSISRLDKRIAVEYRNQLSEPNEKGVKLGTSRRSTILTNLRMVLGSAVEAGLLADNPFTSVVAGSKSAKTKETDSWVRWTDKELLKIFDPLTYPVEERTLRNNRPNKPSHFWVPVLLATTGARPNEVCQLTLDDLFTDAETDLLYFRISDEGEGQRVKTQTSIRDVPIPQIVLDLGFAEYVERVRRFNRPRGRPQKDLVIRLFTDIRATKVGEWARNPARWFNEQYLKQIDLLSIKKKRMYSFRSTLINKAYEAKAQQAVVTKIVGHHDRSSPSDVHTAVYVQPTLAERKQVLDSIDTKHFEALLVHLSGSALNQM